MERLYWDAVAFNNQRMFLTATRHGLNFISNPGCGIAQVYDFYPHRAFEFKYQKNVTQPYRNAFEHYLGGARLLRPLKFDLRGTGRDRDRRVWRQVRQIPYGEVRTLDQIANSAGVSRRLTRAALRANPILLLIPTHRVIVNTERLGRFRESLGMKSQLLEMETIMSNAGD